MSVVLLQRSTVRQPQHGAVATQRNEHRQILWQLTLACTPNPVWQLDVITQNQLGVSMDSQPSYELLAQWHRLGRIAL